MSPTPPTLRPLSPYLSVSGQVWPDQVDALRQAGITWLVNHRPDGEEPGQPTAEAIAGAGAEAGLKVVHIPVRGLPDAAAIAATRKVLDAMGPDDKAAFFCRSGMRSAAAWAMAERMAGAEPGRLRESAAAAGYDLGGVPL